MLLPDQRIAIDKLADFVIGQASHSLEHAMNVCDIPEEWRDDKIFLSACDQVFFCCDCCGWYCSTDELNGVSEQICDDCVDDESQAERDCEY